MLAPALLRRSPFSPVKNNHANKEKNKENSSRLRSLLAYESFSPIASASPEVCRMITVHAEFAEQHMLPGVRFPSDGCIDPARILDSSLSER